MAELLLVHTSLGGGWRAKSAPGHALNCCPAELVQGPSMFEVLDGIEVTNRDPMAPFRMPIMDRYK